MTREPHPPFDVALDDYFFASSAIKPGLDDRARDRSIRKVDNALDALLSAPSPSFAGFAQKLQILKFEYGLQVQPRHWAAIYADVAMLALLLIS